LSGVPAPFRIGLISDTHGLLRPEALDFLAGSDHIVHGGDIGGPEILERLAALAPLTVVRGNNDTAAWARALPDTARVAFGGEEHSVTLFAIHDAKALREPGAGHDLDGVRVVVSGHSHRPSCDERNGILYVNPGAAGRRRFSLPVSAGELLVEGGRVRARLVTLLA
jgi:putative phosphoesterase